MKNLLLFIFIISFTTACKAQLPVPKLTSREVKVKTMKYDLSRPDEKVTQIINSGNRLRYIKMVAPKFPSDVRIVEYVKYDKNLLLQICADVIPLSILQKSPNGFGDWIFITFKVDTKGKVLEMEFLVKNNSQVTAAQIQQIEEKILSSTFEVTFTRGIERYFEGVNYFNIDTQLRYSDMLKAKERP